MHISQVEKNGILICYINGDIDINTAPQFKKVFDKLIHDKRSKLILNFKDVAYVDSSGLATLVEILKGLRVYGGRLKLSNLSTKVKNLFEITKLEKLFDITPEEGDAITSFG
ncbi:MAG: hypothetical protein A2Z72_00210 [Omnitrophica bacterium RBG_13_46_9]|nr:MAG: hypothetical protein A2Z72_00210 [Omnitrophica bacterium RBG_13_46_9]